MTPKEFSAMLLGNTWKLERELREKGWALVNIMNTCGQLKKGSKITLDKVAPRQNISPRNKMYRQYLGMR